MSNKQMTQTDARHGKLSSDRLNEFRKLVRKALGTLDTSDENVFYALPENIWADIFATNFGNDLNFAQTHILGIAGRNNHRKSEQLEELTTYIDNYFNAVKMIEDAFQKEQIIIVLTDTDNDGSFAQSIAHITRGALSDKENELFKIQYARATERNKTRGFTKELVEELLVQYGLAPDSECLIITADNGINSLSEQKKIQADFPNIKLLITDHHNPEPDMCIQENEKVMVFNPHYFSEEHALNSNSDYIKELQSRNRQLREVYTGQKHKSERFKQSRAFFHEYNISGATTFGLLASALIKNRTPNRAELTLGEQAIYKDEIERNEALLEQIDVLSDTSNMLDYVHTHPDHKPMNMNLIEESLKLQSQLNTVNSMNLMILNELDENVLIQLHNKADENSDFDSYVLIEENRNARALNTIAQALLSDYFLFKNADPALKEEIANDIERPTRIVIDLVKGKHHDFSYYSGNPNYIEQLRPLIFNLMSSDNKSVYEKELYKEMVKVFKQLKHSEKNILNELRKINMLDSYETENVSISVVNEDLQRVFNRKLLGKAYNRAGVGFNMILDGSTPNSISGSFRSQYDISLIFNADVKKQLEQAYNVRIETPGHERAAGFIIRNNDEGRSFTNELKHNILNSVANTLENQIQMVKHQPEFQNNHEQHIISDIHSLSILSKINQVTRGMVAHFQRITPLIQLTAESTVHVNQSTGEQTALAVVAENNRYGWTSLEVKYKGKDGNDGVAVLIPNAMLVELNKNGFEDYVRLNYMSSGTYVVESIVPKETVNFDLPQLYFERNSDGAKEMRRFYEHQKQTGQYIEQLSSQDLRELPFFKYSENPEEQYRHFSAYMVERLKQSGKHGNLILDVEAAGFGNAPMFNIGLLNYMIDENSGVRVTHRQMEDRSVHLIRWVKDNFDEDNGGHYEPYETYYFPEKKNITQLLKNNELMTTDAYKQQFGTEPPIALQVLTNHQVLVINPYLPDGSPRPYGDKLFNKNEQCIRVYSQTETDTHIYFNQDVKAENLSLLIKPDTYVIPPNLERLTNIDNDMANEYGVSIAQADKLITDYLQKQIKAGGVIIEAHNTSYDATIVQVNLPIATEYIFDPINIISDSTDLTKSEQLFYFDTDMMEFSGVSGLNNIYFYASDSSSWGLKQMLNSTEDEAQIYDVNGVYALKKKRNSFGEHDFFVFNSLDNTTAKLDMNLQANALKEEAKKELRERLGMDEDVLLPDSININLTDLVVQASHTAISRMVQYTHRKNKKGEITSTSAKITTDRSALFSAYYTSLPDNRIRYNANGVGQTLSVNNLIDWVVKDKESLPIRHLDLTQYPELDHKPMLKNAFHELMHNYDFKKSKDTNLNTWRVEFDVYADLPMPEGFDKDYMQRMTEHNKLMKNLVDDFVEVNKQVARIYDDRWIYKAILTHYQPKLASDLNQSNYDSISEYTGFPSSVVKTVLNHAYAYQQHFKKDGCTQALLIEQHNNGVSHGNYMGDIVYESIAVGLRATQELPSVKQAASKSLYYANSFTIQTQGNRIAKEGIALDTASLKQTAVMYEDRENKSRLVQRLLDRQDDAMNNNEWRIINFALQKEVLDSGKEIIVVVRPDVVLTREQLDEDAKMLSELMSVQQVAYNNKIKSHQSQVLDTVYIANEEKLKAMKNDLQQRYIYAELNIGKKYIQAYTEKIGQVLSGSFNHEETDWDTVFSPVIKTAVYQGGTRNTNLKNVITEQNIAGVQRILDYHILNEIRPHLIKHGVSLSNVEKDYHKLVSVVKDPTQDLSRITFASPASKDLAEVISWTKQLNALSPSVFSEKLQHYGDLTSLSLNNQPVVNKAFQAISSSPNMLATLNACLLNTCLLQERRVNRANLDLVLDYVNEHGDNGFEDYWNGQVLNHHSLYTGPFLNYEGHSIERQEPANYAMKHFPMSFVCSPIYAQYVSGDMPLAESRYQNLDLSIHEELANQMELPPENYAITTPKVK